MVINFLPEIIFIDIHWEQVYKPLCANKMFLSSSVWLILQLNGQYPKYGAEPTLFYALHLFLLIEIT